MHSLMMASTEQDEHNEHGMISNATCISNVFFYWQFTKVQCVSAHSHMRWLGVKNKGPPERRIEWLSWAAAVHILGSLSFDCLEQFWAQSMSLRNE